MAQDIRMDWQDGLDIKVDKLPHSENGDEPWEHGDNSEDCAKLSFLNNVFHFFD